MAIGTYFEQHWLVTAKSEAGKARQKKRILERDLKLLDYVMRGIRSKLEAPAKARQRSLDEYHAKNLNGKRRHKMRTIERAYRGIFEPRQRALEQAMRRVIARKKPAIGRSEPERKVIRTLRRRFEKAVRMKVGASVIMKMTGVTLPVLRAHLESLFQPGMTWENYGFRGWHIDHKRPCASFDLTDPAQQTACFHYTNLQPLWMKENLSKGPKYSVDNSAPTEHILTIGAGVQR